MAISVLLKIGMAKVLKNVHIINTVFQIKILNAINFFLIISLFILPQKYFGAMIFIMY